jgi:hypothetical protein
LGHLKEWPEYAKGEKGKIRRPREEGALMEIRLHGAIAPPNEEIIREFKLKNRN